MSTNHPYTPKFKDRILLLGIGKYEICINCFVITIKCFYSGLLCNFGLAISHIIRPETYGNFLNYLLTLFMANLILYLFFYIAMKVIVKEHIHNLSRMYFVASIICWIAAVIYFNKKKTSWEVIHIFVIFIG